MPVNWPSGMVPLRVSLSRSVVSLALLAIASAPASAAPGAVGRQRVAVAHVDFDGNVSEAARDLFEGRVVEGLAAAQFEVFSTAVVSQKLSADGRRLINCRDGGCYPELAR